MFSNMIIANKIYNNNNIQTRQNVESIGTILLTTEIQVFLYILIFINKTYIKRNNYFFLVIIVIFL